MAHGRTGPYLLQAAIADLHLAEPRDWRQIAALYQALARQTGSPVVELNRAIAVAEIDGPEAGLAILGRLDLDHYRYFHSTRAELLRRAGRDGEARLAYRRALDLAQTEPERRFLAARLAETAPSVQTEPGGTERTRVASASSPNGAAAGPLFRTRERARAPRVTGKSRMIDVTGQTLDHWAAPRRERP